MILINVWQGFRKRTLPFFCIIYNKLNFKYAFLLESIIWNEWNLCSHPWFFIQVSFGKPWHILLTILNGVFSLHRSYNIQPTNIQLDETEFSVRYKQYTNVNLLLFQQATLDCLSKYMFLFCTTFFKEFMVVLLVSVQLIC